MTGADKVVDIVIQGSGVKASAALGAIVELHDAGYTFARMSGTSSGALVAALVMAYQKVGKDLHDLEGVMTSIDYEKIAAPSTFKRATGYIGEGWEALLHGGASDNSYLKDLVSQLLEEVGVSKFSDLRIDDPGSSLPEAQRYSLVMHASDLTRRTAVRLPWDYPEYGLNPDDQLIVDAMLASMAFPLIFQPVDVTTGNGEKVTWIDGGLMANYPLTVFDRTDGKPARWPTFGVQLFGHPGPDTGVVHDIPHILVNSLMTLLEWNRYGLGEDHTASSITIQTGPDDVPNELNFKITPAQREALYQKGTQAAQQFLSQRAIVERQREQQ
jgi:NTE family protein